MSSSESPYFISEMQPTQEMPVLDSTSSSNNIRTRRDFPTVQLDRNTRTRDGVGEMLFSCIIDEAKKLGYENSLAHTKKTSFYEHIYNTAFKTDGIFNEYNKPSLDKLKKFIRTGLNIIRNIANTQHSAGDGNEGESFPSHLKDIVKKYQLLLASAETNTKQSTSQQNRNMQDRVIGRRIPLGNNMNASSRSSVHADNQRNGLKNATRGNHLPGALASPSVESNDGSPNHSTKRMLGDHAEIRREGLGVMSRMVDVLEKSNTNKPDTSFQHLALSHKIHMDNFKINHSNQKWQWKFDRELQKNNEKKEEKLKRQYDEARKRLQDYSSDKDSVLYKEAAKDVEMTGNAWRTFNVHFSTTISCVFLMFLQHLQKNMCIQKQIVREFMS